MSKLRSTLPSVIKKYIWNFKYGVIGYHVFVTPDDVLRYLSSSKLSDQTSVLDLGCGRGSLLRSLRELGWTGSYCGVDISKHAISEAQKIADHRSTWTISDVESFHSPFEWDMIALIESICYVSLDKIPEFLSGLIGMLTDEGRILFRLHDIDKYRDYIDLICRLYPMTEKVGDNIFCIVSGSVAEH